jgi:hypothetical protein
VRVVNAEFGAGILAEIELRKISVKVLLIDVLIDANEAAFQNRKETLQRVGVHVAAHPLKLG